MPALRTHDPQLVRVSFAGRALNDGRDDADFCSTAYNKELYTIHVGSDGSVTRVKSADRSAKATINCMSTSRTHKVLTALYARAQALPGGQDIGTFQVVDLNGAVVESATEAFISKAPDNTYGADVGKRAWEITLAELVRSIEEPA